MVISNTSDAKPATAVTGIPNHITISGLNDSANGAMLNTLNTTLQAQNPSKPRASKASSLTNAQKISAKSYYSDLMSAVSKLTQKKNKLHRDTEESLLKEKLSQALLGENGGIGLWKLEKIKNNEKKAQNELSESIKSARESTAVKIAKLIKAGSLSQAEEIIAKLNAGISL